MYRLNIIVSLLLVCTLCYAKSFTIVFGNDAEQATEFYETEPANTVISSGLQYVTDTPFVQCENTYIGDDESAVRVGAKGKAGVLQIQLAKIDTVTQIVVNARRYNEGKVTTLNVNKAGAQDLTAKDANLTFDVNSAISSILLETSQYAYINSITINTGKIDTVRITKIELETDHKDTIMVGNSTRIYATLTPAKPTVKQLVWTSSNDQIATVDDNGIVTGVAEGKVTITAAANDGSGVKATHAIVVIKNQIIDVTCAEALLLSNDIWENDTTDEVYRISGYITEVIENVDERGRQTFWMADSEKGGQVVRAKKPLVPTGYNRFEAGMQVQLVGRMTVFWNDDDSRYVPMVVRGDVFIQDPTGLIPVESQSHHSKFIIQNSLVIIRDGVRYNLLGQEL